MPNLQWLDRFWLLSLVPFLLPNVFRCCFVHSFLAWSVVFNRVTAWASQLSSSFFSIYFNVCFILIGLRNELFGKALFVGKTAFSNADSMCAICTSSLWDELYSHDHTLWCTRDWAVGLDGNRISIWQSLCEWHWINVRSSIWIGFLGSRYFYFYLLVLSIGPLFPMIYFYWAPWHSVSCLSPLLPVCFACQWPVGFTLVPCSLSRYIKFLLVNVYW